MSNLYSINNLDNLRITEGEYELVNSFSRLIATNREQAIDLLNDADLKFATLFLLTDKIYENNLIEFLSERNRVAIDIINEFQNSQCGRSTDDITTLDYVQIIQSTLEWVLKTGIDDYCSSCEYNEILDMSAIFLIKVYNNISVLPIIAELVFRRKCKGCYTHELVWAFFEARNVESLEYIATGLLSNEKSDVDLAYKLLNFIPNIRNHKSPYNYALEWLVDNKKFIFFTGETQHQRMEPIRCEICVRAKYLNKRINVSTGKIVEKLSKRDEEWLNSFDNSDYEERRLLADYSHYLYKKGLIWWEIWHSYPIDKQVKIAKIGGLV